MKQNDLIRQAGKELRDGLENAIKEAKPELFFEAIKKSSIELSIIEPELIGFFNEYLIKGGYPEIISTPQYDGCDRLLQTYVSDIIAKDFLGKVRKPESLELLLYLLAHNTGRKINVDRICSDVEIKKPTYYSYLSALKKICLVYSLERLPTSLYGKQGGQPKIYINDIGLRNSLIRKIGPYILTENTGELLETVVCDHILRLSFKWNNYATPEVFYWANKSDQEVDFIVKTENFGSPYLPIEAKSEKPGGLKGLRSFIQEKGAPFGIVITKDKINFEPEEKIIFIPIHLFLLLC
jgi:predicted AAA+ superfamily ATPase